MTALNGPFDTKTADEILSDLETAFAAVARVAGPNARFAAAVREHGVIMAHPETTAALDEARPSWRADLGVRDVVADPRLGRDEMHAGSLVAAIASDRAWRAWLTDRAQPRDLQPKRYAGWARLGPFEAELVTVGSIYQRGPVRVISALEEAEYPDGSGERGPQWHVSISRGGRRPRPKDIRRALRAFGLDEATDLEEDNHHPGNARHFWLPVDPARRVDCECKLTEEEIVEPDGYRWTNPREGDGACRGCEFAELSNRPCPLHGSGTPRARARRRRRDGDD